MVSLDSISPIAVVASVAVTVYATLAIVWYGAWVLYASRLLSLGYRDADRHAILAQLRTDVRRLAGRFAIPNRGGSPAIGVAGLKNGE